MGIGFVGPTAVGLYRLHVLASAVKAEARAKARGSTFKMFRRSMRAQAARELGLSPRATHAVVLAALEKRIEAEQLLVESVTDAHGSTTVRAITATPTDEKETRP